MVKKGQKSKIQPGFWDPVLKVVNATNYKVLVVLAIIAPIVTWLIVSIINPTGWMSDPRAILYIPLYAVLAYWPITLPVLLLAIIIAASYRKKIGKVVLSAAFLIISVVSSIGYGLVAANEGPNEFTG